MLVSVCIPVRDGATTIAETLRSVLAQDLEDASLEVVVSDNASTDGTEQVVRPFLVDRRLRYHRTERGLALFESFQRAVDLARGDAVIALGADDVLLPGCLASLIGRLRADESQALALVGCGARVVDGSGAPLPLRLRPRPSGRVAGQRLRTLLLWSGLNLIGTPSTVLIRRSAFDEVGGFRGDAGYAGDLDLWIRLTTVGDADLFQEELVLYRVHDGSVTATRARGQVASVLAALRAADRAGPARLLRVVTRGVLVRAAWVLRRLAVRRALRG